jgi:hypothetical protein
MRPSLEVRPFWPVVVLNSLAFRWIPCKLTDLGDGMKLRLRIAVTYDEQFDVRVARLREQAPRLHIRAECTQVLRG